MFIKRKSIQIANQNISSAKSITEKKHIKHKDVYISQYPILQYAVAFALIGLSTFLLYSAGGGANGLPDFSQKLWWQFLIALLPMVFGFAVLIASEAETLIVSRRDNEVCIKKKSFFCLISSETYRPFDDISSLSVIKRGVEKITFHNSLYYIIISFKTCESFEVLGCVSSYSILQYFQEIRSLFSEEEISLKKVTIHNQIP